MPLLTTRLQLELSQSLLHAVLSAGVARLELPIKLLRFSLGRLSGGEITRCTLSPEAWALGLRFASGPALELRLRSLGYWPEPQVWRIRIESLHFSGFSGAPLLNLAPARVLEVAASQANRKLPGLLTVGKGLELQVHTAPLLQKVLSEASLGSALRERLGLEPQLGLELTQLELLEEKLALTLQGRA